MNRLRPGPERPRSAPREACGCWRPADERSRTLSAWNTWYLSGVGALLGGQWTVCDVGGRSVLQSSGYTSPWELTEGLRLCNCLETSGNSDDLSEELYCFAVGDHESASFVDYPSPCPICRGQSRRGIRQNSRVTHDLEEDFLLACIPFPSTSLHHLLSPNGSHEATFPRPMVLR